MFTFKADIIKRKKVSVVALFIGMVSAAIIGYLLPPFLKYGKVGIVEDFIRQVGLHQERSYVYLGLFLMLLLTVLPAFKTVFQKKVVNGGFVHFDEDNLRIVKGKTKFLIPGEELQEVNFELKSAKNKNAAAAGGSFLKIPTQKGAFICEIDFKEQSQQKDLDNMIKVLKIKHDVKVEVRQLR